MEPEYGDWNHGLDKRICAAWFCSLPTKTGRTKFCSISHASIRDRRGEKYGRLTMLELHHVGTEGRAWWEARCDCGTTLVVDAANARSGRKKSCNCLRSEVSKELIKTVKRKSL